MTLNLGLLGSEMCFTRASHLSASFSFTAGQAIVVTIVGCRRKIRLVSVPQVQGHLS